LLEDEMTSNVLKDRREAVRLVRMIRIELAQLALRGS
jgi:hypothetical protein